MMMRALAAVAVLALGGCGDGMITTTPPASTDMAMIVLDLTMPVTSGPGNQACGATTCMGNCTVCVQFAGGLCAIPCNTAMPSTCATGICHPAPSGNDDGGAGVTFHGDCSGFNGFCG